MKIFIEWKLLSAFEPPTRRTKGAIMVYDEWNYSNNNFSTIGTFTVG